MFRSQPARSLLFAGALTGIGLIALPMATASQSALPAPVFEAQTIHAPQTRMEAEDAIDAVVAGSIIGAIVSSFDEAHVQVKLDDVHLDPLDLEQSQASGSGYVKLGRDKDAAWVPFRYTALYDTLDHSASVPRIEIGGAHNTIALTGTEPASVAQVLAIGMNQRLHKEFGQQQPTVQLETIALAKLDADHASVLAEGIVNFGVEGTAIAQIQALYDTRSNRLLRLDYRL